MPNAVNATNAAMRAAFACTALTSLGLGLGLALATGCASTNDAPAVDLDAPLAAQLAGRWESELDGAVLLLEPTGIFSVDRPARGATPAGTVVGRWSLVDGDDGDANGDGEPDTLVFENLRGSSACEGVRGTYAAEVVRDTVRFTKRADDCPSREEHMAWPWKKPKAE
jgi:hypothetical protein